MRRFILGPVICALVLGFIWADLGQAAQAQTTSKKEVKSVAAKNHKHPKKIANNVQARLSSKKTNASKKKNKAKHALAGDGNKNHKKTLQRMVPHPGNEADTEFLVHLEVERSEGGETQCIRVANIALPLVKVGIGEAAVDIQHWAGHDLPGDVEPSPGHQPVRDVGRKVCEEIRVNDRFLERHVDVRKTIQVAVRQAVHVRNIDVRVRDGRECARWIRTHDSAWPPCWRVQAGGRHSGQSRDW